MLSPALVASGTVINRRLVRIPKDQQKVLDSEKAWSVNVRGDGAADGSFANLPPKLLDGVRKSQASRNESEYPVRGQQELEPPPIASSNGLVGGPPSPAPSPHQLRRSRAASDDDRSPDEPEPHDESDDSDEGTPISWPTSPVRSPRESSDALLNPMSAAAVRLQGIAQQTLGSSQAKESSDALSRDPISPSVVGSQRSPQLGDEGSPRRSPTMTSNDPRNATSPSAMQSQRLAQQTNESSPRRSLLESSNALSRDLMSPPPITSQRSPQQTNERSPRHSLKQLSDGLSRDLMSPPAITSQRLPRQTNEHSPKRTLKELSHDLSRDPMSPSVVGSQGSPQQTNESSPRRHLKEPSNVLSRDPASSAAISSQRSPQQMNESSPRFPSIAAPMSSPQYAAVERRPAEESGVARPPKRRLNLAPPSSGLDEDDELEIELPGALPTSGAPRPLATERSPSVQAVQVPCSFEAQQGDADTRAPKRRRIFKKLDLEALSRPAGSRSSSDSPSHQHGHIRSLVAARRGTSSVEPSPSPVVSTDSERAEPDKPSGARPSAVVVSGDSQQVKTDEPMSTSPTSQGSASDATKPPFVRFTETYPDYTADLSVFVKTCVYLSELEKKRALPSFLYDDFIRVFSKDYLSYIESYMDAAGNVGVEPLTGLQWYNEHVSRPLYNEMVITRDNLNAVLEAYPEERDEAAAVAATESQSSQEAVAAVAEEETIAPMAYEEAVAPIAYEDAVAPMAEEEAVAPMADEEAVAPLAEEEAVAPVAEEGTVAPMAITPGDVSQPPVEASNDVSVPSAEHALPSVEMDIDGFDEVRQDVSDRSVYVLALKATEKVRLFMSTQQPQTLEHQPPSAPTGRSKSPRPLSQVSATQEFAPSSQTQAEPSVTASTTTSPAPPAVPSPRKEQPRSPTPVPVPARRASPSLLPQTSLSPSRASSRTSPAVIPSSPAGRVSTPPPRTQPRLTSPAQPITAATLSPQKQPPSSTAIPPPPLTPPPRKSPARSTTPATVSPQKRPPSSTAMPPPTSQKTATPRTPSTAAARASSASLAELGEHPVPDGSSSSAIVRGRGGQSPKATAAATPTATTKPTAATPTVAPKTTPTATPTRVRQPSPTSSIRSTASSTLSLRRYAYDPMKRSQKWLEFLRRKAGSTVTGRRGGSGKGKENAV